MVTNFAWVVAQAVSGTIIDKNSFKGIYLFAAFFMLLVSVMFVLSLHNFKDPKYVKISILKTMKKGFTSISKSKPHNVI